MKKVSGAAAGEQLAGSFCMHVIWESCAACLLSQEFLMPQKTNKAELSIISD